MSSNGATKTYRIVMGSDDAGVGYKSKVRADLEADPRVSEVIDVGVKESSDKTAYPHVAVEAVEQLHVVRGEPAHERPAYGEICGRELFAVLGDAQKLAGLRVRDYARYSGKSECC